MMLLKDFKNNSGILVGLSLLIGKILAFANVLILVRLLSQEDFGLLTISLNVVSFFIPALGLGSSHGLLRFGAADLMQENKKNYEDYTNWQGLINQLGLNIIMVLFAAFSYQKWPVIFLVSVMMIRMIGLFFVEQSKAAARANFNNKKFAYLEFLSNVSMFFISILCAYFWGIWGYVIGLSISPFLIFFFHKFKIKKSILHPITTKIFWNYALPSVFTLLVFTWIANIDVFLAGLFFKESGAAFYKISVLLPMNIVFVAQVYTQTIFPKLCEKQQDRNYLIHFFINYLKIYFPITLVILVLGLYFSKDILLLFGKNYQEDYILKIAFLQMAVSILLRVPMGSLLSAMGLIKKSMYIGVITLCGILISSYIVLPNYGIASLAYIILFFNIFGGLLMLLAYFWQLRKIKII